MTPQKKKLLSVAFPELAFSLHDDAQPDPSLQKMADVLSRISMVKGDKGDPGDTGYTPIKGKDYWTDEELNQIVTYILNKATPVKGRDYVDGTNGSDGKNADEKKIIKSVLSQIEIPQPKDGTSVDFDEVVKQVLKLIPQQKIDLKPVHKKIDDGMALVDGRIKLIDQRWGSHGGGLSKVSTDSTLTGNGTPSSPLSVVSGGTGDTPVHGENLSSQLPGSTLTLAHTPKAGVSLFRGGLYQQAGGVDYTLSGTTITLQVAGVNGETILCDYEY